MLSIKGNKAEDLKLLKNEASSNQPDFSLDFRFNSQPFRSSLKSQHEENGFLNITHKLHTSTSTASTNPSVLNPQMSVSTALNFNCPIVQNKIDDLNE